MSLTLVSLFDGIGGFPLAFERAGARTVATVEIDKAAAAVSHRHFPHATQFEDVTKVTADDLRDAGFVPDRGILTAGWPCQDFSVAGRRAGLAGARSGLWWEVVRILADLRPRWFIGENVPGLLSSVCTPECPGGCMETHGGAMGAVLGSLGELGYGVAYRVLDAQYFGVPQQRRRVFIVGHLGAPFGAAAQVLLEPESSDGDSPSGGTPGESIAYTLTASINQVGGTSCGQAQIIAPGSPEYATHTHTHNKSGLNPSGWRETGLPDRRRSSSRWPAHRSREVVAALTSNGVGTCGPDDNQAQAGHLIPLMVHENQRGEITTNEVAGTLKTGGGKPGQGYPCVITGQVTHTLTSEGADASEDGPGRGTPIVVQPLAIRGREGGGHA